MEKSRPIVQEACFKTAQTMGRDYYQKVKIGGKNYFAMIFQGGVPSRMQAHDTVKLRDLSKTFFNAHQEASETNLSNSDITHIDSLGIHFREREIQLSRETGIDKETEDLLMAGFDSEKNAIFQHYNQARPAPVAKEAIPTQYRPYLEEGLEDEDGLYDEAAVKAAINHYTLARFNGVKNIVVSANPGAQESIERQLETTSRVSISFEGVINESCNILRQHMTAQTVWKAMINVLLPEQLILVRDIEEEDDALELGEAFPLESDPFEHLNSLGSVPLRSQEILSEEHRDRESEELDPFASVTPTRTSGNWLSQFGSYSCSYLPSRTSLPFVGRVFSVSTPVSRVEGDVDLKSMISSRIVELGSGHGVDGEEEYSNYSSSDEEKGWLDSALHEPLVLHSTHECKEVHVAPLTAQEVHNELLLEAQRAPVGNIPPSSKQAAAKNSLEKIRAKIRKEEDIEAFTENEQKIIREAITRNAKFMQGRSHNSQLTTILGGLETISQGH